LKAVLMVYSTVALMAALMVGSSAEHWGGQSAAKMADPLAGQMAATWVGL
jgi:hypothetical protein